MVLQKVDLTPLTKNCLSATERFKPSILNVFNEYIGRETLELCYATNSTSLMRTSSKLQMLYIIKRDHKFSTWSTDLFSSL